jgi:hypothetical protein
MNYQRLGLLLVLLLFASVSVRAGNRPGLNSEAGANFNGVFFPYAVEGVAFEAASKEKLECSCWRAFGAIVGGASAFVGYVPFALSDSRIGVSDTQRLVEWSAITAGTAYLGYLIGRKFDRR